MTLTRDPTLLSGVIEQITQVGMEHAPLEACGLLMFKDGDCAVATLLNEAQNPETDTFISSDTLLATVENFYGREWLEATPQSVIHENLVLWHTHPHGQVGPSHIDLESRAKSPNWRMLVVTIPSGEWTEF